MNIYPKVSIIVPIYNVEQYLSKCIRSVLEQDFNNFEVLLINDGSTDSSGKICDEFALKDERIKVFHQKNSGLSCARNHGIENSLGEYLIFLDSDDFWLGNSVLSYLVEIADKTSADLIRGEYYEFLDGDKYPSRCIVNNSGKIQNLSKDLFLKKVVSSGYFVWLYLFRRDVFASLRFDEQQKFQEDIELSIRLFVEPLKCVYVPFVFYGYRKRKNSLTTSINKEHLKYSFYLSYEFGLYSHSIEEECIRTIYLKNAIMIYYYTLETLVTDDYYSKFDELVTEYHLSDLQSNIVRWAHCVKGRIFPLFIYVSPFIACPFLRYYSKLKKFIFKLGSKFKKYVLSYVSIK